MDKFDRLMAALKRDPGLLFLVSQEMLNIRVAGPWVRGGRSGRVGTRERRDHMGKMIALTRRHMTRCLNPWEALLTKSGCDATADRAEKHFMTEGEAMRWADEQLCSRGYFLAPVEAP